MKGKYCEFLLNYVVGSFVHGLLITHLKVNRRGCDQVEECNHIHGAHIFLGKIVTISYVIFLDEERELTGLERTASA